ncbi:response regulator [Halolamina sp.]|uniref:response regulator n=1 Tax=Halolamina sp. TaxID=1940283 RepID=UPI0035673489
MGSRFKILFVDDEPGLADLTATFVEREDDRISTVTATNVEVGLERLAEHDVDCIVSDYDMPQQNGLKFLGKVRDRFGSIPFILYTGKGSE